MVIVTFIINGVNGPFFLIIHYLSIQTGLDSVVLKVFKKNVYTSGLRGQYDPTLK